MSYVRRYCLTMVSRNKIFILLICLLAFDTISQDDTTHFLKVNFLYGSKPDKHYKQTERKRFGGLHGGHVTIQVDNLDYGLVPTKSNIHIFPGKITASQFQEFRFNDYQIRYGLNDKTATFSIPLDSLQYKQLKNILNEYKDNVPYDYAFFGMRCASTAHDILAQIGILKKQSNFAYIFSSFYPKMLRRKLFKLAETYHFDVQKTEGTSTRKWEKD